MQLISLALACLFTIFHCQLIGALPNDSVLPMARNGRRTSTQHPDTSAPFLISDRATVMKVNRQRNVWKELGNAMVRIRQLPDTYQLIASGETADASVIFDGDMRDIHPTLPAPGATLISFSYRNVTYGFNFNDAMRANLFYQAMSQAKNNNPPAPPATELSNEQESDDILQVSNQQSQNLAPSYDDADHSTQQRHICTISTEFYDCQIEGVHIKDGEIHEFRPEPHKHITFRDSVLRYLPKSLIDAFPNMTLLNLNQLKITSIENNAFHNAGELEHLYLQENRLKDFPRKVLDGARKLKTLVLSDNSIETMPYNFKNNNNLDNLYINNNNLNLLPSFEYITQLQNFSASRNELGQVDSKQFMKQNKIENIDLSHNKLEKLNLRLTSRVLRIVDISNNKLTQLDITLHMENLNVENNELSSFLVGNECLLKSLKMSNNTLESQPVLLNCQLLEFLDLSKNSLLSFQYPETLSRLRYINLTRNNLFEFSTPKINKNFELVTLDLSHNQLSYLYSMQPFKHLKDLKLNDNVFIAIQKNSLPKSLTFLYVANNEWKCDDVPNWKRLAQDANDDCKNGFTQTEGICCKNYKKAFNDVLNEMMREAYFHERANQNELKGKCTSYQPIRTNDDDLERIRQLAASTDKNKAKIYEQLANTKNSIASSNANLNNLKQNQAQSSSVKRSMAMKIEEKRQMYHVTKEGLLSDKQMLGRVVDYVQERDAFSKTTLNGRKEDTQNTKRLLEQKKLENNQLAANIENINNSSFEFKNKEKELKKQIERLMKEINRNSPSIHGKTGRS
ncbi:AAEL009520-PA [Aedes aegypti]|uniref:AAEL009520-PA n=1 Tax=Aedes aegypti TaxID=7159 RepID=Q16VL8_AEDAE|nr:AAEL009520-PA [Aedes aegypti]